MRSLSINDERVRLALLEPSEHQGYGGANINYNWNIMMMIIWREFFSQPLGLPRVAAQIDGIAAMAGQWPQPDLLKRPEWRQPDRPTEWPDGAAVEQWQQPHGPNSSDRSRRG